MTLKLHFPFPFLSVPFLFLSCKRRAIGLTSMGEDPLDKLLEAYSEQVKEPVTRSGSKHPDWIRSLICTSMSRLKIRGLWSWVTHNAKRQSLALGNIKMRQTKAARNCDPDSWTEGTEA